MPMEMMAAALLWLWLGAALARADNALIITPSTDLKKLFQCSPLKPIGYYNEYFVTCAWREKPAPWHRVQLQGVDIHGADLYADASNVHVELELVLNASSGADSTIELVKSAIQTSAVRLEASTVTIDDASRVDTTALGLKFGPGYNSWFNMGSSFGGLGGAALAGLLRRKCEDIPRLNFYRAIGSVDGDIGNFQGYGSGGGTDRGRGGGRIEIHAATEFVVNGSLVANGGAADPDSSDSAGSGGTVLVAAGHFGGTGTIQANGGEPTSHDDSKGSGGGGGGGGGRIALGFKKMDELNATQLQAFGGGVISKTKSSDSRLQWCQLGGDGTILKVQETQEENHSGGSTQVSILVVKGRRVERGLPAKPAQIYGCTPLFVQTSRGDPFVPAHVAQLFVTGGATVCTSFLVLQPTVSTTNSSIVVESGSTIGNLDGNHTVTLGATHVSIQSYVGPPSQSMREAFSFVLVGGDVALANALVLSEQLDVSGTSSVIVDKFSVVKFKSLVSLLAKPGDVQVFGFLQPDQEDDWYLDGKSYGENPVVRMEAEQNVLFTPQSAQIGALSVELHAGQDARIELPFETPFLTLFATATNLVVPLVRGGSIRECKSIKSLADPGMCASLVELEATSHFLVSLKATASLTVGNVSAGSILACSDGVLSVEGSVTTDGMGCPPNAGPGASSIVTSASGGAGHGGKGGNVEPGNTGGGKAYDFPPSELYPEATMGETAGEVPDAWPVWPGSGAAAGDGSGEIAGGSGGGFVYVGARHLTFSNALATISARGSRGTNNGGGGSGGSITIFVGEVAGSGMFDVTGGDALMTATLLELGQNTTGIWEPEHSLNDDAKPGGGGGGGGIVRTFFRGDEPGTSGNGDVFVQSGGKVNLSGGKGSGGENGGAGIFAAVNCSIGRGGGFCEECEPGAFSPATEARCLPCEPGSYSDKKGLGACVKCPTGSFNADFGKKSCDPCAPGSYAKSTGAKACSPCAPGSFADKRGTATCSLCPNGTISVTAGAINCTVCGIGETTSKPGSLHCEQCQGKPEHATFNVRGKCTYACEKGRTGLDCLTPFERFVKPLGGPLGFAILVFSFAAVVSGSWAFFTYRTNVDQQFRKRFAEYKAQTQRDEQSLTNLTKNLTPRLTDHDLTGHVTRLYFSGDNHLFSRWLLDPFGMPAALKELVRDEDGFATFANSCNQLVSWPEIGGWECSLHRLLLVLAPPLATLFLRKRQLHRVENLAKHVTQITGGFVRELGFRRHGAQLKVGFSPDFSLAYFDVIAPIGSFGSSYPTTSPARARISEKEGSRSPLSTPTIIAVAGSGSFFRPFHVDTNDALVRAVPARLELLQHQFWIDFIAEINQRLRLIQQPSSSRPRQERIALKLDGILELVKVFNKKRKENGDGIRVRFGTLQSTTQFTELHSSDILVRLEKYSLEPFKFAVLVVKHTLRSDSSNLLSSLSETPPAFESEKVGPSSSEHTAGSEDPRPAEFRYSSIRMEALFENPDAVKADEVNQPLYTKLRRRDSREVSTVSDLLLCTPHSTTFRWLATLFRPLAPIFRLRNLRPRAVKWQFLLPFTLLLLLIGDCVALFWVLMEYYCVQVEDPTAHDSGCSRAAFVSVLCILPLAVTGAPLLGIISLTRKSVFYAKLFAVWTLSSIVNLVVAIVCAVVYYNYLRETVLFIITAWLVLKVLEKEVALQCIAQYTVERPLRGWRGLHTTKDWYDAAYTPLIHHEH